MWAILNLLQKVVISDTPISLTNNNDGIIGILPVFETYEEAYKWCDGEHQIIELFHEVSK